MKRASSALAFIVATVVPAVAQGPTPPPTIVWGPAPAGKPPFVRMQLPKGLSMEVPGRNGQDWYTQVGSGNIVVLGIERKKGDAALWVEQVPLASTLDEEVEDQYLIEAAASDLQKHEPSAAEARHTVLTREGHRFVYTAYTRRVSSERTERVLQYVVFTPGRSYRLVCASDATVFDRYAPICGHMARSFIMSLPAPARPAPGSGQ
jgi:hypothetical protein